MQYINPLNFLGTAILGAALLWAVKLAYGRRGRPATIWSSG